MWAAQFSARAKNRHWLSSGGAGTMGFGFPAAIGAQFARPDEPVWAVVGDGGFQMTLSELATAAMHKLPVKVLIINNNYLGMVRQWQELFFDNRLSRRRSRGQSRLRQARRRLRHQGLPHPRARRGRQVLKRAMAYNDGPCVIEAEVVKEDNVFPMIPAGGGLPRDAHRTAQKGARQSPKGST